MKQLSINKFLIGLLFVLGFVLLIPTYKANAMMLAVPVDDGSNTGGAVTAPCIGFECYGAVTTAFNQQGLNGSFGIVEGNNYNVGLYIFTLNLEKEIYNVDEPVKVFADVQFGSVGSEHVSDNIIITGQILPIYNSYTIMNQYVTSDFVVYGSRIFTPPFEAPEKPGNYGMDIKVYLRYDNSGGGLFSGRTSMVTNMVTEATLPYTVKADCNIAPAGYTKCSDEGGACSFPGTANVIYGCQKPEWTVGKNATGSIACNTDSFGSDPLPGVVKACYVGASTSSGPTVRVYANGVEGNTKVAKGDKVTISWDSIGATQCKCSYGDGIDCTPVGTGVGDSIQAKGNPYTLSESKTFSVTCSDGVDNTANSNTTNSNSTKTSAKATSQLN